MKHITVLITVMCFFLRVDAQETDSSAIHPLWIKSKTYHPERARIVAFTTAGIYTGAMVALYSAWYKNYPLTTFHRFNDNEEWLQMDKVGHAGSAYYLSRWAGGLVEWTGIPAQKAAWWGCGISYTFLLTVEAFDGFSKEWGFSTGDMIANTAGAALFLGQELAWKEQWISFKLSYSKNHLANDRPEVFGSNLPENVLKDYNGQTYWLSMQTAGFIKNPGWPKWLNMAIGYGANNMLTSKGQELPLGLTDPGERYRQFFLSPDIEWSKIPTRSGALKTLFKVLGFIKIPAPAVEYRSTGRVVFHGLHF